MKVSHSICGPHEDSDIIFGPVSKAFQLDMAGIDNAKM